MLLPSEFLLVTVEAYAIVAGDNLAAVWALPLLLLPFEEALNTVCFDELEVFDGTHVVAAAVAFVQGFDSVAGKVTAFIAEVDFFEDFWAPCLNVGTFSAAGAAAFACGDGDAFEFQIVLHGEVACA